MGSGTSRLTGTGTTKIRAAASAKRAAEEVAWNKVEAAMSGGATSSVPPPAGHDDDDDGHFEVRSTSQYDHDDVDFGESIKIDAGARDGMLVDRRVDVEAERLRQEKAASTIQSKARQRSVRNSLALSTEDRNKVLEPTWRTCGGEAIEKLLENVCLIDAQYLIDLVEQADGKERKCRLPRQQALPEHAKITIKSLDRLKCWAAPNSLPILVLSYPWLEADHPDPNGWLLRLLRPVLKLMLRQAKTYSADATIGCMLDYGSLPQHGSDGIKRSIDDERIFKMGLLEMHGWYSHPYTHVLLITSPLPTDDEYSNTKEYHQRGWCYYEMRMSSLVKHRTLFWDVAKLHASYPDAETVEIAEDYFACGRLMAAKRPVPMSPDEVAKEFRERSQRTDEQMLSFSYADDLEPVIDLYRRGFIHAIESFPELSPKGSQIDFKALSWGDDEEGTLVRAWTYATKHCNPTSNVRVNLARNRFSKGAKDRLSLVFMNKIALHGI